MARLAGLKHGVARKPNDMAAKLQFRDRNLQPATLERTKVCVHVRCITFLEFPHLRSRNDQSAGITCVSKHTKVARRAAA